MLCGKCQIREATVHITAGTGRAVEEPKTIDLCQECFDASELKGATDLPTDYQASLQAGCRYCGGEFHSGGLDPLALLGGVRRMNVLCKPCAMEYFGYLRLNLPGFGDPKLTKEQMAILAANIKASGFPAILAEHEKPMKHWVAKRKPQ